MLSQIGNHFFEQALEIVMPALNCAFLEQLCAVVVIQPQFTIDFDNIQAEVNEGKAGWGRQELALQPGEVWGQDAKGPS